MLDYMNICITYHLYFNSHKLYLIYISESDLCVNTLRSAKAKVCLVTSLSQIGKHKKLIKYYVINIYNEFIT